VSGDETTVRAAGWYPDPQGERPERYWDGLAWTAFVREPPAATAYAAPPEAPVAATSPAPGGAAPPLRALAGAQRLVIWAILLYLLALVLRVVVAASGQSSSALAVTANDLLTLLTLAALVMAMVGVYRLAAALGSGMAVRILCLLFMLVPLIGLAILFVLNSRATARLRAAGLKVGFLGVRW
jgi:hypothetical protein